MCKDKGPSARAVFENLGKPFPLAKKIRLILKNSALKITGMKNCCGHPGEPGC